MAALKNVAASAPVLARNSSIRLSSGSGDLKLLMREPLYLYIGICVSGGAAAGYRRRGGVLHSGSSRWGCLCAAWAGGSIIPRCITTGQAEKRVFNLGM